MPVDPRIQRILDGALTTPTDLRFKKKRGCVAPPGTGPFAETCGSCLHLSHEGLRFESKWICTLVPFTRADRGTVIALDTKSCSRWEVSAR